MRLIVLLLLAVVCAGVPGTARAQSCHIMASNASDSSTATDACRMVLARYRALTGRQPPDGTLEIGDYPGFSMSVTDGRWTFRWPSPSRWRAIANLVGYGGNRTEGYVAEKEKAVLPHELGHAVAAVAYSTFKGPPPAWYREAVAMWMEPTEVQSYRLEQASDWRAHAPSVQSLLSTAHPLVVPEHSVFSASEAMLQVQGPCRGVCGSLPWHARSITMSVFADGTIRTDTVYDAAGSAIHADSLKRFYVYSLALLYYVRARGGETALHALAARMHADPATHDPLAGLPGVPASIAEREVDWSEWLRDVGSVEP